MLIKPVLFCVLVACSFVSEAANQPGKQHVQASKIYDAKGKFVGKNTATGRHYDAKGKYIGKTTVKGRHYDAKGRYIGKTVTSSSGTRMHHTKGKAQPKLNH